MWKYRCWEEYTDSGIVSTVWPGNKSYVLNIDNFGHVSTYIQMTKQC